MATSTMESAPIAPSSAAPRHAAPADRWGIMGKEWTDHLSDSIFLVSTAASNATIGKRAVYLRNPVDGHRDAAVDPLGPLALPRLLTP